MMPTAAICPIHQTPLEETHPADVENGPHPSDVYNERICVDCSREELDAYYSSQCLAHRLSMVDCSACFLEAVAS